MIYCLTPLARAAAALIGGLLVTVQASVTNAPVVNLSVNDSVETVAYRGWPIQLRVEVLNESLALHRSDTNSQTLTAADGPWVNALQIQWVDSTGQLQPLDLRLATDAAAESLEVTADSGGEADYWILPEETARLAEGTYHLTAILDTTHSPSGWSGVVRSAPVMLKIAAEPAALDPDTFTEKWISLAEFELWRGRIDEAEGHIAQLLALQPDNVDGLGKRGDLLQIRNRPQEALAAYGAALTAFYQQNPTTPEPPRNLLIRHASLQASLRLERIVALAVQLLLGNPTEAALQWPARLGERYSIESSQDLMTWSTRATNLLGTSSLMRCPLPLEATAQFFRVRRQSE